MYQEGEDPLKILGFCREAMEIVGERFEKEEYFLPELVLAGEVLKQIANIVQEGIVKGTDVERLGKVIIGTVEGDLHDIGKDIVTFMLDVNGFDVLDLGIDVPVQKFVDAIQDFEPQVVGLSAFLTTTFSSMKDTVEAIKDAGLRDNVKIMIGGGQINDEIRQYTGADAYGLSAVDAVNLSKKWVGGE
jgi:5-methyltetrahydrofolate--homocysteine methyltransferase